MSSLNKIETSKLTKTLSTLWESKGEILKCEFKFQDYLTTMKFVNEVSELAKTQNHHPTMIVGFDKVEIQLTTHDNGNKLTRKDFKLAKAIDQITMKR
tara:strand:+ start:384 stop:677 length:294 start_codon:yes stop_codon:yes gene_type:complete